MVKEIGRRVNNENDAAHVVEVKRQAYDKELKLNETQGLVTACRIRLEHVVSDLYTAMD